MVYATSLEHAPLVRALARAGYANGARYVEAYYEDQHIRRAMIELAPDETLTWSAPWMIKRAEDRAANKAALIAITGDPEPELLADLDGERVGRARPIELDQARRRADVRPAEQLVRHLVPERRLGGDGVRRARRRAAVGGDGPCRSPGRGRPGRRLGRARREAPAARGRAQRARVRRRSLSRAWHRSHHRPAPGVELGGRRRYDELGPALHRERPHRGGLHHPGLAPDRGHRPLDPARCR